MLTARLHFALLIIAGIVFGSLALGDVPQPAKPERVVRAAPAEIREGLYTCRGEIDGEKYACRVEIQRNKSTYAVVYYTGAVAVKGVGMRSGDKLIVGWVTPGGQVGVTEYTIGEKLTGRYVSIPGSKQGTVGTEELVWVAPALE